MPQYPPSFAAFTAFEKLGRDQVEVVRDASPLATLASWERRSDPAGPVPFATSHPDALRRAAVCAYIGV